MTAERDTVSVGSCPTSRQFHRPHRSRVTLACLQCGEPFLPWTTYRPSSFCSRRCVGLSQRAAPSQKRWAAFARHANEKAGKYGAPGRLSRSDDPPVGPCAYCGGAADTWDHVDPLVRLGVNALMNLVPACGNCNRRKQARTLDMLGGVPLVLGLLCGWCWSPIVRTSAECMKAERRGRRYFTCGRECCISLVANLKRVARIAGAAG